MAESPSVFTTQRLEMIQSIEKDHFWFQGRLAHIRYVLDRFLHSKENTIYDLGCGTGYNLREWTDYAENVIGVDQHAQKNSATFSSEPNIEFLDGDVTDLQFDNESSDVVIALDVLEHVNDHAMLKEVYRVLKSDGIFVASVPAYKFLWSDRDVQAGHMRRYTPKLLTRTVEQHGFKIDYTNHFLFTLFPLILISRIVSRLLRISTKGEEQVSSVMNSIFTVILRFENTLVKWGWKLPIGSTIIICARKTP